MVKRTSHLLSYLLHPAVLIMATALVLGVLLGEPPVATLVNSAVLLLGLLPGLSYIVIRTRRGAFSHYHLLLREERYVVLPMLIGGLVGSLVVFRLLGAAPQLQQMLLVGVLVGVGAAAITRVWKISLHAAVAMGCAALLLTASPLAGLLMAGLGLLTGLARLPIRHHTPAQVAGGWVYGLAATLLLLRLLGP